MRKKHIIKIGLAVGLSILISTPVLAKQSDLDYTELAIEDLLNVQIVTTVSKKPQKISDAAAAIFVITEEDIRRSGATSVAEALRMVPGLNVARVNSHAWAISARGFNRYFASKLLVLVDGRSVYTPEFSGVYWETVDVVPEDIARIEVIRGPGGTLWGANAVNGVINIITKSAKDSQGGVIAVGGGSEEKAFGRFRYGASLGPENEGHFRIYGKAGKHDASEKTLQDDGWYNRQAGFRIDMPLSQKTSLTLQGDAYHADEGEVNWQTFQTGKAEAHGANLLARWERKLSTTSNLSVQAYYDYYKRATPVVTPTNQTLNLELQHSFDLSGNQQVVWGLGYRRMSNNILPTPTTRFNPPRRNNDFFSAFIQDEITLVPDKYKLILGSKFEHNAYTGLEVQPNARFLWTPNNQRSVWASVSRAVRTPSRVDHDLFLELPLPPQPPLNIPVFSRALGNIDIESETVLAYELGMRSQESKKFIWDAALFYNRYDNLIVGQAGSFPYPDPATGRFILQVDTVNAVKGNTYGFELAADWVPLDWWRFRFAYTYLNMDMEFKYSSTLLPGQTSAASLIESTSPQNQLSLRSNINLKKNLELDVWLRYVDSLGNESGSGIDSYTTMDVRLAWQATKNLQLSVVGQNLLEQKHAEFSPDTFNPLAGQVERGFYGQLRWQY